MRTGVPAMAYARGPDGAAAALRGMSRAGERHGDVARLQVAVLDGYPYWVVADPDREDGWVWFDALTGGRIAGPHEGGG